MCSRLRSEIPAATLEDTVVSILFDQSGSLRNKRYIMVAETAEALADALTGIDIATEILGFTTAQWKGGRSRLKWIEHGRPSFPGRLNDLMHIVYLDAEKAPHPGPHQFPLMRCPYLLKENIDGEALEWAYKRILMHPRCRKILIAISDGAPVDDFNFGRELEYDFI